jgi:outer membrane protein assembly factor BamB
MNIKMKKLIYIFAALCLGMGITSCMPETLINDTDTPRHQIENLKAVVGDEEVTLSWTVPQGWEPTDYQITYNDADAVKQTILTGGKTTYTVMNLVNGHDYAFNVQAIYDKAISNIVDITAKPVTSRIAVKSLSFVTDPDKEKKDQYVELTWEKPSDLVLNYTLTYYPEMTESDIKNVTVDKDATSYRIEGITNEDNYVITLTANYPKGAAPAAETKVYFKIAYFVNQTSGATGQVIRFQFNKEAYPTATDIKWEFPGGTTVEGETAEWVVAGVGKKDVILSATINGKTVVWPGIELTLRQNILETTDFVFGGGQKYNGFKGSYPVFSPDGKTIYDVSFNKISNLYAYDLTTGEEKWRYVPDNATGSYNPPTVNPVTGDIYYGTQTAGEFYCVTPEGQLRWKYTGAGSMQSTAPAVSADGNVLYILDKNGKLAALNTTDGSEIWTVALGKAGAALLIDGDTIFAAVQDKTAAVHILNRHNGTKVAETLVANNDPTDISGFAVSDDKKTAYMPLKAGGMMSIDLVNLTKIAELTFAANNVYAPVVASNGYVVAGSKDGCVYALSPDLKEVKWTFVHGGTPVNNVFNYSHACADDQGRVFITSGQTKNNVYILDAATGNVLSSESYGENNGQKQMGGNNFNEGFLFSAFVGAAPDNGAFIGQFVGGNRKFWGGPGGDICGSCCLQSPIL